MTLTNLRRRARRRSQPAARRTSSALVVALMMALVFAPVVGLHVACAYGGLGGTASADTASTDLMAQRGTAHAGPALTKKGAAEPG